MFGSQLKILTCKKQTNKKKKNVKKNRSFIDKGFVKLSDEHAITLLS